MTKTEILTEMQQLQAFIKNRELNLPEVVQDVDLGLKAAQDRLSELEIELDKNIKEHEKVILVDRKKAELDSKALNLLLEDARTLASKFEKITSNITKARALEVAKGIRKVTR